MPYTPNYIGNNTPNFSDFHFSLWQLVKDILAYYDALTPGDDNYFRELQNGAVFFGYSDQNLKLLNNSSNTEFLITIQYDSTNLASIIDDSKKGFNPSKSFTLPYQFTIRSLTSSAIDQKAVGSPKFRIQKIFDRLEQDLCNSNFTFQIVPNTINYLGVVQSGLSDKQVQITCASNRPVDNRFIDQEAINTSQYITGSDTYQIHFKQDF